MKFNRSLVEAPDLVKDKDRLLASSRTMDTRHDWSKFLNRGSKVIFYTPSADYTAPTRMQYRVYEQALKKSGVTVQSVNNGVVLLAGKAPSASDALMTLAVSS